LKGVYARLRGLWTGVNGLEDAASARTSRAGEVSQFSAQVLAPICLAPCAKEGSHYHLPVLAIETHGSFGGSGAPFCNSPMECLSVQRTKAITPSRGGRLMVTPAFINFSHSP